MSTPRTPTGTPRIPTGRLRDLGPVNWAIARVIARVIKVPDAHLFSTLARTGGLFRAWLFYSGHLMPGGKLSRFESEMVILRVAHLRGAYYELDHHTRLGERAGIDRTLREAIFAGPSDPTHDDRRRALLTAVDEMVTTRNVGDASWTELARHLDERRLVEFALLVTQYDGLATTLATLRVPRDYT